MWEHLHAEALSELLFTPDCVLSASPALLTLPDRDRLVRAGPQLTLNSHVVHRHRRRLRHCRCEQPLQHCSRAILHYSEPWQSFAII